MLLSLDLCMNKAFVVSLCQDQARKLNWKEEKKKSLWPYQKKMSVRDMPLYKYFLFRSFSARFFHLDQQKEFSLTNAMHVWFLE